MAKHLYNSILYNPRWPNGRSHVCFLVRMPSSSHYWNHQEHDLLSKVISKRIQKTEDLYTSLRKQYQVVSSQKYTSIMDILISSPFQCEFFFININRYSFYFHFPEIVDCISPPNETSANSSLVDSLIK